MTYDLHGAWESFTHHNAPLKKHPSDTDDSLNVVGIPCGIVVKKSRLSSVYHYDKGHDDRALILPFLGGSAHVEGAL